MFTAQSLIGIFVTVLLGFQVLIRVRNAYFTPLRHIPGPLYAKFTNWGLKVHIIRGQRAQYIHKLHSRYGQYVRIAPNEVAISNLDAFRTIHRFGTTFYKSPWYAKFNETQNPGIFAMTDPKAHAARRRLFAQQFSNSAILCYEQIVRKHVEVAVGKIERDASCGCADILKWWTFMATDISAALSFGKSFGMLESEKRNRYIEDLETAITMSGIKVELPYLMKVASLLPIKAIREARGLPERLRLYGEAAIANHKEGVKKDPELKSLFRKFLDMTKHQETISESEIVEEASNLIVAGSDTTAVTLTYMTWLLLKPAHLGILRRLLSELADLPVDATASSLAGLDYFQKVVDETLRLYGAAPGSLPRLVPPSGAQLGDFQLPAGATVSTQAYTLHRDPEIFPEPERFWPERWDRPTQAMRDAFSPFGAGSRTCIGLHLAKLEMQLAIFKLLKTCPSAKLAPTATDDSMEIENFFLIAPKAHKCEIVLER